MIKGWYNKEKYFKGEMKMQKENLKWYHKDIYFVPTFYSICDEMLKNRECIFTNHCMDRCKEKGISISRVKTILNNIKYDISDYELFEVQNGTRYIIEFALRVRYSSNSDISIVFANDYDKRTKTPFLIIKTMWLNNNDDIHSTLDAKKYCKK